MKGSRIDSSSLSLSDSFSCIGANAEILDWLSEYIVGKAPSLDLNFGTSFQKQVALALNKVPFGKTVSYGNLSTLADCPRGARAVGNALNKNPFALLIPCHRVIMTNGKIGGFAMNLEIKRRLLEFEASFSLPQR